MQKLNLGFLAEIYNPDLKIVREKNQFAKNVLGFGVTPVINPVITRKPVRVTPNKDINPITGKPVITRKLFVINLVSQGFGKKEIVTETQKIYPEYNVKAILSVIANKRNFG